MEAALLHLILNVATALLAHIAQHLRQHPFQRVVANRTALLTRREGGEIIDLMEL